MGGRFLMYGQKDIMTKSEIYTVSRIDAASEDLFGGKSYSIVKLKSYGFPVLNGIIVSTNEFVKFLKYNKIDEKVQDIIKSSISINEKSSLLTNLIKSAKVPEELKTEIKKIASAEGIKGNLIVRSSANVEDSTKYSFAGQFETKLNVKPKNLEAAMLDVYASVYSVRALTYIERRMELPPENIKMGLLIQEFVDTDFAGVTLTSNPINGDKNKLIIEYVKGLGEHLVSGEANPVHIELNKKDVGDPMKLLKRHGGLDANILVELSKYMLGIEKAFNAGMDIEWGVKDGKIMIFQARRITTGK